MIDSANIKITRSSRRSIAVGVLRDGTVEVRAPKYIPKFLIDQFVKSKSDWIEERLEFVAKNKPKVQKFENGEKFLYLGKEYSLLLGNYIHIETRGDDLLFPLGLASQRRIAIEKWYIKKAKEIIKAQVDFYADRLNTSYNGISFSDTSSKWGSCTHDNKLQFNWRLIMTPILVVRYVVLHELVHTTEKNHSAIFWNKVRAVNPSYKNQIKWLKQNGNQLFF